MLKLTFNEPNRNLAWNDNGRYSFRKNITSQEFSTNRAMNTRCRSPEQHKAKVPPTATLGIAHQRHCAQHHRHHSHLCRRGGEEDEGDGALWFRVLWVILKLRGKLQKALLATAEGAQPRMRHTFSLGQTFGDDASHTRRQEGSLFNMRTAYNTVGNTKRPDKHHTASHWSSSPVAESYWLCSRSGLSRSGW